MLLLAFFCVSCSGDDNGNSGGSAQPRSRNVKFEITGNFTGQVNISYTSQSGGSTTESITLPWSKEITYDSSVSHASIGLIGAGGVNGQTATIKVSAGGTQVSSTPATAGTNGAMSAAAPAYSF